MPIYVYENPESGERKEILQGINDTHSYSENGSEWNRVWIAPQIGIGLRVDPFSVNQFLEKTSKPGTIGDLWDRSLELSERRADKLGEPDQIRVKAEKEAEKRRGRKIPKQTGPIEI